MIASAEADPDAAGRDPAMLAMTAAGCGSAPAARRSPWPRRRWRCGALGRAHPDLAEPAALEIVVIRTTGDRVTDRPLAEIGGKGLFTKEIEEALLGGRIDLAVHSIKDLPTWLPDGPRDRRRAAARRSARRPDRRDGAGIDRLPRGAVVGTASLAPPGAAAGAPPRSAGRPAARQRRDPAAQARGRRGRATLLALAGLERLGHRAAGLPAILTPEVMLPAVGQGAIGDRVPRRRRADARPARRDRRSGQRDLQSTAERALLAALDGSCHTPIAGHARPPADGCGCAALVARPDGSCLPAHDPRRSACGWRGARARCRPGAEGARRARLLCLRSGSIVGEFVRCAS